MQEPGPNARDRPPKEEPAVLIVVAVVMAAVWIGLFSLGMQLDRSSRRGGPARPAPAPDRGAPAGARF